MLPHRAASTLIMKHSVNPAKEAYKQLRKEPWETLWEREVPLFDSGNADERLARIGLVRAIGVVALEKATQAQRQQTRQWLTGLLQDPEEKIRRYAMNVLPKLGSSVESRVLPSSGQDATPRGTPRFYQPPEIGKLRFYFETGGSSPCGSGRLRLSGRALGEGLRLRPKRCEWRYHRPRDPLLSTTR